jgi:hypothetical protein
MVIINLHYQIKSQKNLKPIQTQIVLLLLKCPASSISAIFMTRRSSTIYNTGQSPTQHDTTATCRTNVYQKQKWTQYFARHTHTVIHTVSRVHFTLDICLVLLFQVLKMGWKIQILYVFQICEFSEYIACIPFRKKIATNFFHSPSITH